MDRCPPASKTALPGAATERAARLRLGLVLFAGALVQVLVRLEDWLKSPLSKVPVSDARHNWQWAGRIASGQWIDEAPFFGAPLLPYLLAIHRLLGGELLAWVVLQVLFLLAAALLAAQATRRLSSSPAAPALAAGLLLFCTDCAHAPGRLLSGPLQLLLVAAILERASALRHSPSRGRTLGLGLVLGLSALAWPVLLYSIPVLCFLHFLRVGLKGALLLLLSALLTISPATLHNLAAGQALIPITAHAGLTFYHGNNPGADGTITGSGLSMDKAVHRQEALGLTRSERGPTAGWPEVSAHFFEKGLAWWRAEPLRALGLAGKKALLFLGAQHYGDIDLVTQERGRLVESLWLAPLPAAWIASAGVFLALLTLRRPRSERFPAALILLAAFLVVTLFWYTPRYRLPALPAAAVLVASALPERGGRKLALAGLALGLCSTAASGILGWDRSDHFEGRFRLLLARAWNDLGERELALKDALAAAEAGELGAKIFLAEEAGGDEGLEVLRVLAEQNPTNGELQRRLAVMLAERGELEEAERRFSAATALDSTDWRARQGLAAARLAQGDAGAARVPIEEALALAPGEPDVVYTRGIVAEALGESGLARACAERALVLVQDHGPARELLVRVLRQEGEDALLVEHLRRWLLEQPERWPMRALCAWILATSPEEGLVDGPAALGLLEGHLPDPMDADALDTLAAAQAASGQWQAAEASASQALHLAEAWPVSARQELERRLLNYRARLRWIEVRLR